MHLGETNLFKQALPQFAILLSLTLASACAPPLQPVPVDDDGDDDDDDDQSSDLKSEDEDEENDEADGEDEGDEGDEGDEDQDDDDGGLNSIVDGGPNIDHSSEDDAHFTTVDATDPEVWILLDLETGAQIEGEENYASSGEWDLAFQRFKIRINGGISGPNEGSGAIIENEEFHDLSAVPEDAEFIRDALDGGDEDTDEDLVFAGWYAYDVMTHILTPHPYVYIVDTGEGMFKIQIDSYYNMVGTPAMVSFRWAPL